jgi:hypothetical protein
MNTLKPNSHITIEPNTPTVTSARHMRDLIIEQLNKKTGWGSRELRRLIDDAFMETLERMVALGESDVAGS